MTRNRELHINTGMQTSASISRISTLYFPVYLEGELIGNLTGDDLKEVLEQVKFKLLDELKNETPY